mmetsp:Transcript_61666/g.110951  ORF Transcript_61666/g.110951 Transcript_61666/m.110951 type:complete len:122 (+) Transcript_61666:362-727(+)
MMLLFPEQPEIQALQAWPSAEQEAASAQGAPELARWAAACSGKAAAWTRSSLMARLSPSPGGRPPSRALPAGLTDNCHLIIILVFVAGHGYMVKSLQSMRNAVQSPCDLVASSGRLSLQRR